MEQGRTNRLLGYREDARLLIVNADDFGMCHSNNSAIMQALTEGIVSSTSLMALCPWAPQAMELLRAHPEVSFGVHLTLVSEFGPYRWGPVASKRDVPSLLDETGCFPLHEQIPELIDRMALDEVEREYRAQIERVLAAKLQPDHLDWHCIPDGGRDDIFALTVELAREYGLAVRGHGRTYADQLQARSLPVNDHEVLDSYGMSTIDKGAQYARKLRELPPGLNEWAVHPGLGTPEAQAIEPGTWQVRRSDFDFVISRAARTILDEEGIVLLDYGALQRIWKEHA